VSCLDQPVLFDPFAERYHQDPYPAYAAMREEQPVCHQPELDFWFVSRYDDVSTVVNDWETFTVELGEDIDDGASLGGHDGNLVENDPPRHRALRRVVQGHWTPTSLAARLSGAIDAEVARLVDDVRAADGRVDLGSPTASRLPVAVISEFLGVEEADRGELVRLQMELIERDPGVATLPPRAIEAAARQREYFAAQLASRRRRPGDDLLTLLVQAEQARTIQPAETLGLAHELFSAAIDTTASLLTNMFMLLATHPDQQDLIRADPSRVDGAVEEILRFESPIQNAKRTTTCGTTLADAAIPAGATVVPLFGSANRDDRRFERADVFDVRREPQRNLAFGAGIHHCLGAPLARLEARKLLGAVVQELPPFELAGEPVRFPNYVLRGMSSVPLVFGGA